MMLRTVRRIARATAKAEQTGPRSFQEFGATTNIILLGDPGAGKTELFKQTALEEGGRFLKARSFLRTPSRELGGGSLFIDGLDEQRTGRADRAIIDELVDKLIDASPDRVRLNCRAADWLGDSDISGLAPFFERSGDYEVLLLLPLSREQQIEILTAKGDTRADATTFLNEAVARGLSDFLGNPQNLLMLRRAVVTKKEWPATRQELYDISAALLLAEFDDERARLPRGIFSPAELRPAAGAICAARLISDVDGISLKDNETFAETPSYRSIAFLELDKVSAALGRRVFVAGARPESVEYTHRTIAEFLGAEFLAEQIRQGLPIGRVTSLLGVRGHPTTELRGLHAWLAVHSPECADELIDVDPYAVLTYGDPAALSRPSCVRLIKALAALSNTDPTFYSPYGEGGAVAGLAREDMTTEFRRILRDPASTFGVRSVVIDALRYGRKIYELMTDLEQIVASSAATFSERSHALQALARYDESCPQAIERAFHLLGTSIDDLRIRAEIIKMLYGQPFGAADVVLLLNDMARDAKNGGTGLFWSLADAVPIADIPEILTGIVPPTEAEQRKNRSDWQAGAFYARLFDRLWVQAPEVDENSWIEWFHRRFAFKGGHYESRGRDLRQAMLEAPDRVVRLVRRFIRTIESSADAWILWRRFRQALFHVPDAVHVLPLMLEELSQSPEGTIKRRNIYPLAVELCFQSDAVAAQPFFEALYALGDADSSLQGLRDSTFVRRFPIGYYDHAASAQLSDAAEREEALLQFDRDADAIREGRAHRWLINLANVYFGSADDVDRTSAPGDRLLQELGRDRAAIACAGFAAAATIANGPSSEEVFSMLVDGRHNEWWFVLSAGLNERSSDGSGFSGLNDDFLKAMVAFDIACPSSKVLDGVEHYAPQPWRVELTAARHELVRETYLALTCRQLASGQRPADGLNELLTSESFASHREAIITELIQTNIDAYRFDLAKLLSAAVAVEALHQTVIALCRRAVGDDSIGEVQRDLWLVTAYRILPDEFQNEVIKRVAEDRHFVFEIRDQLDEADEEQRALSQSEFLIRLAASVFPNAAFPNGAWNGDRNDWDAAGWVRKMISRIGASPTRDASAVLERLRDDGALVSFRNELQSTLAGQLRRRRDAEYNRPDWQQTLDVIANGVPANSSDLFALLVAEMTDLKQRIARSNTDIFKRFWNVDKYSRPEEPRPEENNRDALVDLLRARLTPHGINVEPEVHMAADKRADFAVSMTGIKVPCELKRNHHVDVWKALEQQLQRLYVQDPEAGGYGVFGVFWFGKTTAAKTPAPPGNLARPRSADEMERMLRDLTSRELRKRIAVIVLDVSGEY